MLEIEGMSRTARVPPVVVGGGGGSGAGSETGSSGGAGVPRVTMRERKAVAGTTAGSAGSAEAAATAGSDLPKLRPMSVRYPSEDELIEAVLQEQRNSVYLEQRLSLRSNAGSEAGEGTVAATATTVLEKAAATSAAPAAAAQGTVDSPHSTPAAATADLLPAVAPPPSVPSLAPAQPLRSSLLPAQSGLAQLCDDDEFKLKRRCEGLIRDIRVKAPEIAATHVHTLFVAAANYDAADEDEMSFSARDEMLVHRQDEDGWWLASRLVDGTSGYVPATYMKPLLQLRTELAGDTTALAKIPRSSQYILDESEEL